jgi:hypothetical protein
MGPDLWLILNDPDYWLVGRMQWAKHVTSCREIDQRNVRGRNVAPVSKEGTTCPR